MPTSVGAPRRIISLSGAILTIVLAACAGSGSPIPVTGSPGPSSPPTNGPTTAPSPAVAVILLQITSEGGFINPSANLAALPTIVVYTDGRILMRGAAPSSNPDPLLPRISVRDTGSAGAAAILAAIHEAGLDKPSTEETGVSVDSGISVFAVTTSGSVVTTRYAASGPGRPGGGGPQSAAAFDLLGRLLDTSIVWGTGAAPETTYQPLGYRVFAAPSGPVDPSAPSAAVWPLAATLAEFGTPAVPDLGVAGLRAGAVLGADAATVGPVLDLAVVGTTFTSAGVSYSLWVRPLLPHELPG